MKVISAKDLAPGSYVKITRTQYLYPCMIPNYELYPATMLIHNANVFIFAVVHIESDIVGGYTHSIGVISYDYAGWIYTWPGASYEVICK